jgi:hypothetical protein
VRDEQFSLVIYVVARVWFVALTGIVNFSTTTASKVYDSAETAFLVASNSGQTFIVTVNSKAVLTFSNFQAQAGKFSVKAAAASQTEGQIAVSSGRTVLSDIWTFSHSQGSAAVGSVTMTYDVTTSTVANADANRAAWFKFDATAGAWVQPGSTTVSGNTVVYANTAGFSDWSVQQSNSAMGLAAPSLMALALAALFAMFSNKF